MSGEQHDQVADSLDTTPAEVAEQSASPAVVPSLVAAKAAPLISVPVAIVIAGLCVAAAVLYTTRTMPPSSPLDTPVVVVPDIVTEPGDVPVVVTPGELPPVTLVPDDTDYSQRYTALVQEAGVTWYTHPISRGDYGYVTPKADWLGEYVFQYYEIGTRGEQEILFVSLPCDGMCFVDDALILLRSKDGTAELLTAHSVDVLSQWFAYELATGVTLNTTDRLRALSFAPVTVHGEILSVGGFGGFGVGVHVSGLFANSPYNTHPANPQGGAATEVSYLGETAYGPLYRLYYGESDAPGVDYHFAIRTAGGLYVRYDQGVDFVGDDRVPQITWLDGTTNTAPYRMDGLGSCGGGGPEIARVPLAADDLALAGYTIQGDEVYQIVDLNHPLITRVFAATQKQVYTYDAETGESAMRTVTDAEFLAAHGVIVVQNNWGEYLVLTHGEYGPQAECAKPVIYLYPPATTTVAVQLDALVTVSDPLYENGWVVEAAPDGTLMHHSGTFSSLFWDGYGNGPYPVLTAGYVVRTSDALVVMSEHLAVMGFLPHEIADFTAFWQDHLPDAPYTQFSWIDTKGMNELAPLSVEPRPDTVLRAFVDFRGVEQPVELTPQPLLPVERRGFVVTEWGGILRR